MKSWNKAGKAWLVTAATLLMTVGASPTWVHAVNGKGELACHAILSKGLAKHAAAVTKAMATCNNAVLSGAIPGPCPDTTAQTAIDKSAAALAKTVNKKCVGRCTPSSLSCIDSDVCPPIGITSEQCYDSTSVNFEMSNMGFPGPYCEGILGGNMTDPEDFGSCAAGVGEVIAEQILGNTYGSLASPPAAGPATCLAAIVKAAPKAALQLSGIVAKCRNVQLKVAEPAILPEACATGDLKTSAKVETFVQKFKDAIAKKCTDTDVAALDLCGEGIGATNTVLAAQTCLAAMIREVAYSTDRAETRTYAATSIINGAYPSTAAARCGDNLVNQDPNQFMLNGEECDGTDDSACPGECLPPGDIFQCTCGNIRRSRAFAYGFTADLDNGWSGASHNSKVTDGAGFVAGVSGCDCSEFDDTDKATCKPGQSSDPNCDVEARLAPRCSHKIYDAATCDQNGNNNGANTDADCRACDAFAENAGDYCVKSARFCVGGANTGQRCNAGSDCPGGTCPVNSGNGRCLTGPFAGNGCNGAQNCNVCVGGSNAGNACAQPINCPGGTCASHTCATTVCLDGVNQDAPCGNDADCPGSRCAATSDCAAQCYEADGTPTGTPCAQQSDCTGDGQRCRGRCDEGNTCVILRNGAPLPLSSKGTSVCLDSQFHTDMVGTRNILDGSHDVNYELRSVVILSGGTYPQNSRPCPVCGGWCAVNSPPLGRDVSNCEGTCVGGSTLRCRVGPQKGDICTTNGDCGGYLCTNVGCRFQSDCDEDGGGTCSGEASPECGGKACRLDLACGGGLNHGKSCRIEANTAFGTTSSDCPSDGANQSGSGLAISWTPLTSGTVTLEGQAPCNAAGYQNFDCNCVTGGGVTNRPNDCDAACNDPDPAYYGRRCSSLTVCVGGPEAGVACDADSDCTGGVCSGNPRECGLGSTGSCSISRCVGGSNAGNLCQQAGQCPSGSCVAPTCEVGGAPCTEGLCVPTTCTADPDCDNGATCDDACPAGRCTPLCVDRGHCVGGPKNGLFCAIDTDCPGGSCDQLPSDENEGACANGSFDHCDGRGWEFISCSPVQVNTQQGCEMGTDTILGNANDNIGAGYCRRDIKNCFVNNGYAEGGTTGNGKGDPTNTFSVATFCIPAAAGNSPVNPTAGLPGPGRIRQRALVVPNYSVLP
jgi:hypothetical protein